MYRWPRIKTGKVHIWDFYYIFINHKFIPFAITHIISKCLKHITRKLFKLQYVILEHKKNMWKNSENWKFVSSSQQLLKSI